MRPLSNYAAVAILVLGLPLSAGAAADPCIFGPKIEVLKSIQSDPNLDSMDAQKAELAIRRDILLSVIQCGQKEVAERQKELETVPAEFKQSKVHDDIFAGLKDMGGYYRSKEMLVEGLGIKGTQDLAREIAYWRSRKYLPLTERESNFILWTQAQPLFTKARARFAQIRPVILSLSILNYDDARTKFSEAELEFEAAERKNEEAKAILDEGKRDALPMIKESLEPLASIYKKFFEVSESVKKLVP